MWELIPACRWKNRPLYFIGERFDFRDTAPSPPAASAHRANLGQLEET
jgi:hypothetical protein